MKKRMIAPVFLLVLIVGVLTLTASAADIVDSGNCGLYGNNVMWTLDNSGMLTISGTGPMADYTSYEVNVPWFDNRFNITTVIMENGVTSIGVNAFAFCPGVTRVTIPDSVTEIKSNAFAYCHGLTSVTIPNSVTTIGDTSFWNCGLTRVTIPNGVTKIGYLAFDNCDSLTSVTISNSVTEIGDGAFSDCDKLTSINVEHTNAQYSSENGVLFNKNKDILVCYPAGKSETTFVIPNSVISVGYSAFYGCSALTNVDIPSSVTEISNDAFRNCKSLTSVMISNSVVSIGDLAFYYCSVLTSVTIPNSVTEIGEAAFGNCNGLTSVMIPNSLTEIGERVFEFCSGLRSVTIPNSVTSIGSMAFRNCDSLTDVYYGGRETQWKAISIGDNNNPLKSATIHYNNTTPDKPDDEPKISKAPITFLRSGTYRITVDTGTEVVASIPNAKPSDFGGWNIANNAVIRLADSSVRELNGTLYATAIIYGVSSGTSMLTVSAADGRSAACTITVSAPVDNSVNGFDADIYRADWLLSANSIPQWVQECLNKETPSHQLCIAGQENGLLTAMDWWDAFKTISNSVDDATSVVDMVGEPKDLYIAIILDTLEEALSSEADVIEEAISTFDEQSDYLSLMKDSIESFGIIDNNITELLNLDLRSCIHKRFSRV